MEELDPDFMPMAEMIDSLCTDLVIRESDTRIVRLAHYTTKEYLLQNIPLNNAETDITRSCLTYLSMPAF